MNQSSCPGHKYINVVISETSDSQYGADRGIHTGVMDTLGTFSQPHKLKPWNICFHWHQDLHKCTVL